MSYSIKEIYYTLQGEGAHTGRPAVFVRFAGCNLWSGREEDRDEAICTFCDTDFVGTDGPRGGRYASADDVAEAVAGEWPSSRRPDSPGGRPYVVCTGGEPLLQLDDALIGALHAKGFEVAIESNGTKRAPAGIDWICISPKEGAPLVQLSGDELKLVYPQEGAMPEAFERLDFARFYLQPMDGPDVERNTRMAVNYCLAHPKWRLSLQTHKVLRIP